MAEQQKVTRKLSAILSADVKGYSRLMSDDESHTIKTLKEYQTIMTGIIDKHSGRVVDTPGDNMLAEFSSIVNAVQSAVEIQKTLKQKNTDIPYNKKLEFRIGVNIGDVVQDGEKLYGDGVNIAARIEALAEPGGVCISRGAYDHIRNKLELGYEYIGEHKVKNIKHPVRVYKLLMEPADAGKLIGDEPKPILKPGAWATVIIAAIVLILIGYQVFQRLTTPEFEQATIENMAYELPDKPSIAVMPFANISNDPKQDFLSDGLTDEIIIALSKVPDVFVIARNSMFTYKEKPFYVKQIAEELGVRYILNGSILKVDDNLRINVQLIDALKGYDLWAERYDRKLEDIFKIFNEITLKIIVAMEVALKAGEQAHFSKKGTDNLEAYLLVLRGIERFYRLNSVDNIASRKLFQEAISIDPDYSVPYAYEARTHAVDVWLRSTKSPKESINQGIESVQTAISLDNNLGMAHGVLSVLYLLSRQHKEAIEEAKRWIVLNPNCAEAHNSMGQILTFSGRAGEAIAYHKTSLRLDPFAPSQYLYLLGMAYREIGKYNEAVDACAESIKRQPDNIFAHLILASTYAMMNKLEEAQVEATEVLRINPNFTTERLAKVRPHIDPENTENFISSLLKAGLPEKSPVSLPAKPSIAVLPFDNMNGDPEQEYFSDGISEDIITTLSKSSSLFVVARNSTFRYKGKPVNIKQVAEELGVRYILEGSVRKSNDRVRITAQLIDAVKGNHLWAERYDRDLKDIFELQDEITMKIVTAMQVELTEGDQARMFAKQYKSLDVMLKHMEARSLWAKGNKKSYVRLGRIAQEIIDMAPESEIGYRLLAWYYWGVRMYGSHKESVEKAFKLAQKSHSKEPNALSHGLLGSIYLMMRKYEKAIAEGEKSIELDPNGAMLHGLLGYTLYYTGKLDEAIKHIKLGIRLNPFPEYWYNLHLGRCYMHKGLYKEALNEYQKALLSSPNNMFVYMYLAVNYVLLDRYEEAKAVSDKILETNPDFSVDRASKMIPYKNQNALKLVADSMRKAGLPD